MLTEEQLEIYGDVLVPVFQQLEQDVIADIARRVRKEERWTETAELQAEELRKLGWSPYRIRIEVLRRLQASKEYAAMVERNTLEAKAAQQAAIDEAREALREQAPELFETVGNMAFHNDLSVWEQAGQKLTRGGAVDAAVSAMRKHATGEILNLTRTLGFSFPTGSVPARKAFTAVLNSALAQVVSGTVSYQQACANAVRLLTQSGLRHIDYKNNVARQIDTAVRNAVLTASAQLSGEIMQANIEESGVEYVQVSAHWGARESHEVWQGKVYSLAEFRSVCGYGEPSNPDHIYSYNCRHTHYPYWPGISEPVEYPPEPGPFEVDGKKYTYYQATQRQRAMERSIRAMKRDALAQDAMGDRGALAAAKIRLDEKMAAYKRFSAQVNMRPRLERTQVFGYDRGAAAKGHEAVREEIKRLIFINDRYRSGGDPLYDALGPISKSHPDEVLRIRQEAEQLGVSVKSRPNAMAYAPGLMSGMPGQLFVSEENSYGAWLHEERHMLDDAKDGFAGFRGIVDTRRRIRMEYRAYAVEINLAKELGRDDIVEELVRLRDEEIATIKGEKT